MLLTAGERTLLHLLNFWTVKAPPEAITRRGIAAAAGLRRSHVPRTVKALAREGHLEERVGRVRGRGRKIKVYFLTEAGLRRARGLAKAGEGHALGVGGGPATPREIPKAAAPARPAASSRKRPAGRSWRLRWVSTTRACTDGPPWRSRPAGSWDAGRSSRRWRPGFAARRRSSSCTVAAGGGRVRA